MPVTQIDIGAWRLEVDSDITAHAYEQLSVSCECGYCRNFLAVLDHLPQEFYQVVQRLGVNPYAPAEIVEYVQNPDGTHFYSWWYHANGRISTDDLVATDQFGHTWITPVISLTVETKADLVAPDFPQPIIQIEFFANLPWVLDEPDDSDE